MLPLLMAIPAIVITYVVLERVALSQAHQTSQPTSSRIHALTGMGKLNGPDSWNTLSRSGESGCKTAIDVLHTCMKMNMFRDARGWQGARATHLTNGYHASDDHPPHWRAERVIISSMRAIAELEFEEWK
jgi:hypothetical protein